MCVTSLLCGPWADLWPFYGLYCKRFSLYIKFHQGCGLQRSGSTDPPKENGRKFAPTASVTFSQKSLQESLYHLKWINVPLTAEHFPLFVVSLVLACIIRPPGLYDKP